MKLQLSFAFVLGAFPVLIASKVSLQNLGFLFCPCFPFLDHYMVNQVHRRIDNLPLVPFSMVGNSNDSSYEAGIEVSQQHGSGILDCDLDNDRTFLCLQQSSKILYYIYEEWFGDSKSVFTTKLCEAGTEDVLCYV